MRGQLIVLLGLVTGCGAGENAAGNRPPDPDSVPPITTVLTLEHTKDDGDRQTGTVRTLLPQPLKVRVMKGSTPIPGVFVTWSTDQQDAEFQPQLAKSDEFGYARTFFTPGSRSGLIVATASIPGVTAQFFEFVVGGPAASIEYAFGGGVTSESFPALSVLVKDGYGNPSEHHPVTWTVVSGTFSLTRDTSYSTSFGLASVQVRFGDSTGSVTVEADGSGFPPVVFNLTKN